MSASVGIRRIQPDEWAALRDIRLRAIRDTPDAFAVSLAETLSRTEEGWTEWATGNATGEASILYVAEDAARWIGMAGGLLDTSGPKRVVQLISMWVDPACRGRGLGRQLVERVAGWAAERAALRLELWVTADNTAAIELYARCGFRETGERKRLPSNPALTERKMARDL